MKKLTAILTAAVMAASVIACDQPGSDLTPTVKEIGQELLVTLDDMRVGRLDTDAGIAKLTPLSERLYDEIEHLDGDEEHAATRLATRAGIAMNGLFEDAITLHEVARDELADILGEPTKYDRNEDLRELFESYVSETVPDSEWVD